MATLGLGISIGSYADAHVASNQDTDLNRAFRQVHQYGEQLQQEYGVYTACTSVGSSWGNFACGQEVRGYHSYVEKVQILREFNEKLSAGRREIFASIDEGVFNAEAIKGFLRLAGVSFGLSLVVIGIAGVKAKEEK